MDLNKVIDDLLASAYIGGDVEADYQANFADEGSRKAEYIVHDLLHREGKGQLITSELGYLCIGGADGSELEHVMADTEISKAVMLEISDIAVARAKQRSDQLAVHGKQLMVLPGDATANLGKGLAILEAWSREGVISGLVCSAQGVLHELPRRSPGFDLPTFLGMLFRDPSWQTRVFYSREPCRPAGWPSIVRIRIPEVEGTKLARAAAYFRDRLRMSGEPKVLTSGWVMLPAILAVETLHKLIRGNSLRRIEFEFGEQLTDFDPMAVQLHLESYITGMRVNIDQITTADFKKALEEYDVQYRGHDSSGLPVPHTHSEMVGFFSDRPKCHGPLSTTTPPKAGRVISEIGGIEIPLPNPFGEEVPVSEIISWLSQFEPEERPLIAKLLRRFVYISFRQEQILAKQLHAKVIALLGDRSSAAQFVPLGSTAGSGEFVAYLYREANRIPRERFLSYSELGDQGVLENKAIVLLDDLLASGHQAANEWKKLQDDLSYSSNDCRIVLATLVGCEAGMHYLSERTNLEICSSILLAQSDEPLDSSCDLFAKLERADVRRILKKYGEMLAPQSPFGYSGRGILLSFAHSTPDNALPIFWSTMNGWSPLLRSRRSSRGVPTEWVP